MQDGPALKTGPVAMSRIFLALLIALVGLLPAGAQGFRETRNTPGNFDFYVLALSWSPAYCQGEGGRRSPVQCESGRNPDFVVHGLWPQYERGFPSNCGLGNQNPTRADMQKAARVFPEEGLARYQWRKHGSCAGGGPGDYFEDVAAARSKVAIPDLLKNPQRSFSTTPLDIERAFVEANRGLRADMMSVQCNRNILSEVRICFSRDLRGFVTCPEVNRSGCRVRDVSVPVSR
jgi:ribonuclease T2